MMLDIKHPAVHDEWTPLDVLHMDDIVKMPATSSRKPEFADVEVVVLKESTAHKVLKMVYESKEPMRLRTGGEGGHDHGAWEITGIKGSAGVGHKVTLTLGFFST